MIKDDSGKNILRDSSAESASPDLPAFIARPAGAPVYHGFPIVTESATEGWFLGLISDCADPAGCEWGDAFVIAPDDSRAGIVWQVGKGETYEILPADGNRWGVYGLWFPETIRNTDDIIAAFRLRLPELQAIHAHIRRQSRGG